MIGLGGLENDFVYRRGKTAKNTIDSPQFPPLLSAAMKTALILVVGLRMGKAV